MERGWGQRDYMFWSKHMFFFILDDSDKFLGIEFRLLLIVSEGVAGVERVWGLGVQMFVFLIFC